MLTPDDYELCAQALGTHIAALKNDIVKAVPLTPNEHSTLAYLKAQVRDCETLREKLYRMSR